MKQPFEELVEQHGGTVLRVCRVVVGVHDAEDAWSETFLAAMRAYPDLPEDANTEAWLVTIAHRKAIDVLRARGRQPVPTEEVPEVPSALGVPGEGDDDLWQAVPALPGKQRQAVAYHYVAGGRGQCVASRARSSAANATGLRALASQSTVTTLASAAVTPADVRIVSRVVRLVAPTRSTSMRTRSCRSV